MNAHSGASRVVTISVWRSPWSALIRCSVVTAAAMLAMVSVLLVVRRCSGGLTQPIATLALLMVALVLASLAAAWRWLWFRCDAVDGRLSALMVTVFPAIVLLLFAGSISLPGTSRGGLLLLWVILVGEEVLAHWLFYGHRAGGMLRYDRAPVGPTQGGQLLAASATEAVVEVESRRQSVSSSAWEEVDGLPDGIWQQISQTRDEDGHDAFYGRLRGEFATGQRSTSLHVAFCPPLDTVPQVFVEQIEGPEVTIKAAQILPYGVRFDVKRMALGESCETVIIEFYASSRAEG